MDCGLRSRLTRTWLALVVLTIASMVLAHSRFAGLEISTAILVAAAMKAWWIILDFLELRHAPAPWRGILATWIILITAAGWAGAAISILLT